MATQIQHRAASSVPAGAKPSAVRPLSHLLQLLLALIFLLCVFSGFYCLLAQSLSLAAAFSGAAADKGCRTAA